MTNKNSPKNTRKSCGSIKKVFLFGPVTMERLENCGPVTRLFKLVKSVFEVGEKPTYSLVQRPKKDRSDRITAESPGTKQTASHGWTWFLTQLRKHIS